MICQNQDVVLNKISEFYSDYQINKFKNVCTPAIQGYRYWNNVELMKDKGVVGYFFASITNSKPIMMFCSNKIEYSFREIIPEMNLIFSNSDVSLDKQYFEYLSNNYKEIDVLILHGMYNETIHFLDIYRKLRPDGKVFCGLDMNTGWLERIDWSNKFVVRFANQCDVIATSSTKVRDILNAKKEVKFSCYYLPNGFANLNNLQIVADASYKKNIILTVGRIGTEQKNNIELLLAFARVSENLSD